MSVRVLIVDDEAPARRRIRSQLAGRQEVTVAGEAGSGPQAVDLIRDLQPDLVFLDIQMPAMNGFEVIEAIGAEAMPAVVFVTAYDEFAVEAFEVEAVDYVLKPFTPARLAKALERALAGIALRSQRSESLARLLAGVMPGQRHASRLVVRSGERIVLVPVAEVVRLSADGNHVRVQTAGDVHRIRDTLAGLERRLDPDRFARVHRGEIVAIDAILEIQPWFHGDYVVILKSRDRVRLSRRYAARLLGR